MSSFADFDRLVDSAYDLGATTQDWQVLVRELAAVFDSRIAVLVKDVADLGEGPAVGTWFKFYDQSHSFDDPPPEALENDPLMARVWAASRGEVVNGDHLWARPEFLVGDFGRYVLHAKRVGHTVHIMLPGGHGASTFICMTRDPNQEPFSPQQLRTLKALAPHVARAIHIGEELAETRTGPELLDLLNYGVVLLDRTARLLHTNARARELLAEGDGLCARGGRLQVAAAGIDLERMIPELTRETTRFLPVSFLIHPKRTSRALTALLAPPPEMPESQGRRRAAAVLVVSDPTQQLYPQAENLQTQYGLTEREAGFTLAFSRARGLKPAARELGISWETARRHLKSVFEKTDTHSQPELIDLLLRHPAAVFAAQEQAHRLPR